MKKMKNNLDERQEKQLLHIEKNGCWFAFWALVASIFIQQSIFGITDFKSIGGEFIVFMILAIYIGAACLKNGIWDRHLKANPKTNFTISVIAAILSSILVSIINHINFEEWKFSVITFVITTIFIFIICFMLMSFTTMIYRKQLEKLENEHEKA